MGWFGLWGREERGNVERGDKVRLRSRRDDTSRVRGGARRGGHIVSVYADAERPRVVFRADQLRSSSQRPIQHTSDVVDRLEVRQERAEISQLGVMWIVEPCRYRNGVVGVEDVGSGRVVDDDAGMHLSAELGEVLE